MKCSNNLVKTSKLDSKERKQLKRRRLMTLNVYPHAKYYICLYYIIIQSLSLLFLFISIYHIQQGLQLSESSNDDQLNLEQYILDQAYKNIIKNN